MCFVYEDYDWVASDVETYTAHSDGSGRFRCNDCGDIVPFLQACDVTEMHECVHCSDCGFRHSEDFDRENDVCVNDDGEAISGDLGESCLIHRCQSCVDFRLAIRDLELSEGCREYEAVPVGSIRDEFGNMQDPVRVAEYLRRAEVMFPSGFQMIKQKYGEFTEGGVDHEEV